MNQKINSFNYQNFIIHHYHQLESSNKIALELVKHQQIFDHEIICCDIQTHGRGRDNRNWISPLGNLYFSMILNGKNIALENLHQLSFVASISLNQTITKIAKLNNLNLAIKNKWPNDLMINNNKVAGILIECMVANNYCQSIVIGIGVNINNHPDIDNNNSSKILASNLNNFGIKIERLELLKKFIDEFENYFNIWLKFGFKNIRKLWLENAYLIGETITLLNHNHQTGIFKEIDDQGNLILQQNQQLLKFSSADLW